VAEGRSTLSLSVGVISDTLYAERLLASLWTS
jgi:hypothetical protein